MSGNSAQPTRMLTAVEVHERLRDQRSAINRVKGLHFEVEGIHTHTVCAHVNCRDQSLDQSAWPCPTIRALEAGTR